MTVTISAMFIPVHDPDSALGFYRDALGLEVRNDLRDPSGNLVRIAQV